MRNHRPRRCSFVKCVQILHAIAGKVDPEETKKNECWKTWGSCDSEFGRHFTMISRNLRGAGDAPRIMGDKSPKATNKQANQKQAKNKANTQKKNTAAAAKQTVVKGKK